MRQNGICTKCGKYGIVQNHHIHGYLGEHKDEVVLYCRSCDQLAHNKARREGRCLLPSNESTRLSRNSVFRRYNRAHRRLINFTETLLPNIELLEQIRVMDNGNVTFCSYFKGNGGYKIKQISLS